MPEIIGSNSRLGKEMILHATIDELRQKSFLENLFAAHYDKTEHQLKPASFNTTDPIQLTPAEYKYVGNKAIDTTLGRLYMNRFLLEYANIIEHIGYYNQPLTKKGIGTLDRLVVELRVVDKIDALTYAKYIDTRDLLGFWCTTFTSAAVSSNLLRPIPEVEKRKKELIKQNADRLYNGSPVDQIMAVTDMENEIIIHDENDLRSKIYTIRGQQVMLDFDLAEIYGYSVKAFNQQVKNNIEKFDSDFMFQLNETEFSFLRSKFLTSKHVGMTVLL